jgi:hypothetical protein
MLNRSFASHRGLALPTTAPWACALVAMAALCAVCPGRARASLTITPTFDTTITSLSNAAAVESAINAGIANIEANITSPNTVNASVYFYGTSGGRSSSDSRYAELSYYQSYNALKALATSPVQLTALASLGPAPTSDSSPNPVNGSTYVQFSYTDAENLLGVTAPASVGPGGAYDGEVSVSTDLTYTQTAATHEVDEILGIGAGSEITFVPGNWNPLGPVGPLDLFRYSAPGVRSFTNSTTATSLFLHRRRRDRHCGIQQLSERGFRGLGQRGGTRSGCHL